MATLSGEALLDLWNAVRKDVPFNTALGIVAHWAKSPYEYGSPLGPERKAPGGPIQVFTKAAIQWGPSGPVKIG